MNSRELILVMGIMYDNERRCVLLLPNLFLRLLESGEVLSVSIE